jgi:hypothetical protein
MARVKVWISFPDGLPREVIEDRLQLLSFHGLSLRVAEAVIDSWDTRDVPGVREGALTEVA